MVPLLLENARFIMSWSCFQGRRAQIICTTNIPEFTVCINSDDPLWMALFAFGGFGLSLYVPASIVGKFLLSIYLYLSLNPSASKDKEGDKKSK